MKTITIGKRFGKLVVVSDAGQDERYNRIYNCVCDCGNKIVVTGSNLRCNYAKSCGCRRKENVREIYSYNQKGRKYAGLASAQSAAAEFYESELDESRSSLQHDSADDSSFAEALDDAQTEYD